MNHLDIKKNLELAWFYFRKNNYTFSKQLLEKIIQSNPDNLNANELLAYIHANLGNLDISYKLLKQSCKNANCSAEALYYLGSLQLKFGLYLEASISLQKSIEKGGLFFEALHDLGTSYGHLGKLEEALYCYQNCLKFENQSYELQFNIARCLDDLKHYDEALNHYDQAIQLKPDYPKAWSNKGGALKDLKRYDEALSCYDKAIAFNPDFAEAWSNKGMTLHDLRRHPEALLCYNKAIALKPDFAEAWLNKGATLHDLNHYDEAISHYNQAIQLKPNFAEAFYNKALTLNILKRYEEALSYYEKAIQQKPDLDFLCGDLLHLKMKICDWSSNNELLKKCIDGIKNQKKVINPFQLLALTDDLVLQKKCSEIYSASKYPISNSAAKEFTPSKHKKIRLGYFSADFRDHAVSSLTVELFENHNKDKFEIYAFSYGIDDKSAIRKRLQNAFDKFIDVRNKSDTEIASLARNMGIDIAIDLGGHTSDNRLSIFTNRVAPIQVTYIGYIGTLGTTFIDYLIADKVVIPSEFENFYSEKIIKLPFYQISDSKRTNPRKVFTKADLGIPDQAFVFCCFNNNYKILPVIFDSWISILNAVNNSVLFLFAENQKVKENLIKEAKIRGLDENRLIFGGSLPKDEYMARYLTCDLFLDTFPYNAGTTANDALWMGLPILTYSGQSFASRMATSLLHAIGLEELCVDSLSRYEEMAIFLGNNPKELANIKKKLDANKFDFPIFQGKIFTENLEEALTSIHTIYINGAPPAHLEII